jgi:pentatricopeptide repeat protein
VALWKELTVRCRQVVYTILNSHRTNVGTAASKVPNDVSVQRLKECYDALLDWIQTMNSNHETMTLFNSYLAISGTIKYGIVLEGLHSNAGAPESLQAAQGLFRGFIERVEAGLYDKSGQKGGDPLGVLTLAYNAMIEGHLKISKNRRDAMELYEKMMKAHSARETVFSQFGRSAVPLTDEHTHSLLITAHAKDKAHIPTALRLYSDMKKKRGLQPNSIIYTSLITGLARHGDPSDAVRMFNQFKAECDKVTKMEGSTPSRLMSTLEAYPGLMEAYCRAKDVDRVIMIFNILWNKSPWCGSLRNAYSPSTESSSLAEFNPHLRSFPSDPAAEAWQSSERSLSWSQQNVSSTTSLSPQTNTLYPALCILFDACGYNNRAATARKYYSMVIRSRFPISENNFTAYMECVLRCTSHADSANGQKHIQWPAEDVASPGSHGPSLHTVREIMCDMVERKNIWPGERTMNIVVGMLRKRGKTDDVQWIYRYLKDKYLKGVTDVVYTKSTTVHRGGNH